MSLEHKTSTGELLGMGTVIVLPVAINAAALWSPCTGLHDTGHCSSPKHPISSPKAWGDLGWGWGVLPSQPFVMASSALSPIPGWEGRKKFPDASDSADGGCFATRWVWEAPGAWKVGGKLSKLPEVCGELRAWERVVGTDQARR